MNKYFLFGGMFLLYIKLHLIKQMRNAELPSKIFFFSLKLSEHFYELKTLIYLYYLKTNKLFVNLLLDSYESVRKTSEF